MSGHPCSMADGRCLRCGKQGMTGGCPTCPMPVIVIGTVVIPTTVTRPYSVTCRCTTATGPCLCLVQMFGGLP